MRTTDRLNVFRARRLLAAFFALAALFTIVACADADRDDDGLDDLFGSPAARDDRSPLAQPTETPVPGERRGDKDKDDSMEIDLDEVDGSGQDGTAVLKEKGDKTEVRIEMKASAQAVPQPAAIFTGTCDDLGDPAFALVDVTNGISRTTLDVSLDDLKDDDREYAIAVQESERDPGKYVACGDIDEGLGLF